MKLRLSSIALTLVINFVVSNVTLAQVVNPDNCLFISMIDGYGDGWNGATFTITDSHGDTWATGTLATGSYGEQDFCIPDGCYHVEVTAGL
ncbi:MAG: hypothetical protein JNM00_03160, partial [Flavobacteriales bacterium]|nr:hypothetical protein [Flavobacteriales bacterium]